MTGLSRSIATFPVRCRRLDAGAPKTSKGTMLIELVGIFPLPQAIQAPNDGEKERAFYQKSLD
jgi:hypothetical protein